MTQRICLVTHSWYPVEPRSLRMAEALVGAGYEAVVLCLAGSPDQPAEETSDGVRVVRLPVARHQGADALVYLREYARFFRLAAAQLWRLHRERPFSLIQVHNPPDALIFATLPIKLRGVPIILDLRELMPELFMSRFGLARDSAVVRVLTWLEQLACAYASSVLVLHERHRRIMLGRGIPAAKLTQVMNCPDERVFDPARLSFSRRGLPTGQRASDGLFVVINHGGLFARYGVDLLVKAVALARERIPGIRLELYGAGDFRPQVEQLVADLELGDVVRLHGQQPIELIPEAIAAADVGVAPMRQDVFTDCGLPTKLLEYVTLGVPAVASRTATTADYFDDSMVQLFTPGDPNDLARGIIALFDDPVAAQAQAARAQQFTEVHNWRNEKASYLALIRRLTG